MSYTSKVFSTTLVKVFSSLQNWSSTKFTAHWLRSNTHQNYVLAKTQQWWSCYVQRPLNQLRNIIYCIKRVITLLQCPLVLSKLNFLSDASIPLSNGSQRSRLVVQRETEMKTSHYNLPRVREKYLKQTPQNANITNDRQKSEANF